MDRRLLPPLLAAPGLVALVVEPAVWLIGTWTDPSYESDGALAALAVAALYVRAVRSGPAAGAASPRAALGLLVAAAAARLAGRVLAIHLVGAVALVLDVAAIGLLLGVQRRPWAVSPWAAAALFGFALPVENVVQRVLGHPLQLAAASVAERALAVGYEDVVRTGTLLGRPGIELAIDLPCSGARGLTLLAALAVGLSCRRQPGVARLGLAAVATIGGAVLANTLRIVTLFAGADAGLPVIAEPWHGAIGLAALLAGAVPVLAALGHAPARAPAPAPAAVATFASPRLGLAGAALASVAAVAVTLAPERPVDVSRTPAARPLPASLGPWSGAEVPLSPKEARYFAAYGGSAEKRAYDDGAGPAHTALVVRTSAPLRHLHGPDRCLVGAGHVVERLGVRPGAVPTIVWRSVAPDGVAWRVEASFVSDRGESAASVSEVVFRWLERPGATWTLVERISPFEACERDPARCRRFDEALFASLDANPPALAAASEGAVR